MKPEFDRVKLQDKLARAVQLLRDVLALNPESTGAEVEAVEKAARDFVAEVDPK